VADWDLFCARDFTGHLQLLEFGADFVVRLAYIQLFADVVCVLM
jgi:hypothetical protein